MNTFASIQPKPALDQCGDRFEKEADNVSDRIDASSPAHHPVSRTHSLGGEAPRTVRLGLRASGQELDASTRADMEHRLGFDLSQVRIHADATAAASACAISAKAFTTGTDVVFAAGQYRPDTAEGRKLLAHELTHVAQQRGGPAVVQRKADKQRSRPNWGTAPAIVSVQVQHRYTGPGVGYYANGEMTPIEIVKNTLETGTYTLSDAGAAQGPSDADYVLEQSPRFAFRHPVANMHSDVPVTVVVRAKDRFAALPDYIRNYLYRTRESTDREELADEGEQLLREGITAADIALASDPKSAIEMSSAEDVVDSLRRRGFTDFPTRDEYYRRLAWQMANTSDVHGWMTKDEIAEYWRERPEEATESWQAFAGEKYTEAKEAEAAKWLEAFRRIDAAAGVVDAIAIVTLVAVGGFLTGPSIASGVRVIQSGAIQGVPVGVWAKTFAGAGLSAGYLSAILTRSEEAAKHGDANPVAIFAAAVNDALGSGKVYEAITNESLLTGEDLKKSTSERIIGGLTGGLELGFNFLGAKDFVPEYSPNVKPPGSPTPEAPSSTAPKTTSVSTSDPMLAQPPTAAVANPQEVTAVAPWSASEVAAMDKQGIPSLSQYRAAREAQALELAQQQTVQVAAQEGQAVRMAAGGMPGTRVPQTRMGPASSSSGASRVGGTTSGPSVFKRSGAAGQRTPYAAEGGTAFDEAEDIASSMEALKTRDPGMQGKVVQGEFPPENIQRGRTTRTTEYDPAVGDSALLGDKLRRAGLKPAGPDDQAHHMIPSNEPMADQVRNFITERGFKDINDVDNGVWLPTRTDAPNLGAAYKHEFTFDNAQFGGEYFHRLEDIFMVEGITEKGIRLRLRMLRDALLRGELPPADAFANVPL